MMDLRALKLLESMTNYDYVISLSERPFVKNINYHTIPETAEQMTSFRETVNAEIKKCIN